MACGHWYKDYRVNHTTVSVQSASATRSSLTIGFMPCGSFLRSRTAKPNAHAPFKCASLRCQCLSMPFFSCIVHHHIECVVLPIVVSAYLCVADVLRVACVVYLPYVRDCLCVC